ncbi:MAG: YceI family protein [Pseudomonadota bacterium]
MSFSNRIAPLCALFLGVSLLSGCGGAPNAGAASTTNAPNKPWSLVSAESRIAFASIKADAVGETHSFQTVAGGVEADGTATLTIDLASVETNIDIRNERMRAMLFEVADHPTATLTTDIDLSALEGLAVGERQTIEADLNLSLHGLEAPLLADLTVTRLAPARVLVETTAPVFIAVEDFDLAEGLEQLREVAGLPSITPISPVTAALVFEQ